MNHEEFSPGGVRSESVRVANPQRPRIPLRRKIVFALLPVLALVVLLETAARCIPGTNERFGQMNEIVVFLGTGSDSPLIEPDPELFWVLRPDLEVDERSSLLWRGRLTNSDGLRNARSINDSAEHQTRIVCLGDSTTFGLGSLLPEAWPSLLKQQLNSSRKSVDFEVINAGVPGYTSHQGRIQLQRHADDWSPDLVIATFGTNDCWQWNNRTDQQHTRHFEAEHSSFGGRLRCVVRLADWIRSRRNPEPRSEWADETVRGFFRTSEPSWIPRVTIPEFVANLRAMHDICKRQQADFLLIIWPDRNLLQGMPSPRRPYVQALRDLSRTDRIPVCDLLALFERHCPSSLELFVKNDIVHVRPQGNRLACGLLTPAVAQLLSGRANPNRSRQDPMQVPIGLIP